MYEEGHVTFVYGGGGKEVPASLDISSSLNHQMTQLIYKANFIYPRTQLRVPSPGVLQVVLVLNANTSSTYDRKESQLPESLVRGHVDRCG